MRYIKKISITLLLAYVFYFIVIQEKYYFDIPANERATVYYNRVNYVLRYFQDTAFQNQWRQEETPSNYTRLDVVIPVVEKDLEVLPYALSGIRNMIFQPLGKVYLLAPESAKIRQFAKENNCEFIFEDSLFEKEEKEKIKKHGGWIYQQFLKLAVNQVIEQEHYLIIDADTVLIRPQIFIQNPLHQAFNPKESKCILNTNGIHYAERKRFTKKALKLNFSYRQGFVIHHMLFRKQWMAEFKQELEKLHNANWKEALLKLVEEDTERGLSEYDMYATFVYNRYPNQIKIVAGANLTVHRDKLSGISDLKSAYAGSYKSLSFHHFRKIE